MSHACTPILVGVVSPVSEILLPSKMAKFPFRGMDYSPWSSKNSIDQNRLKKFMQIGIDVTVHVHQFWGAWFLRFRRYCHLSKTAKFPFRGMDYSPWSSKNLIDRNWLKKFMQVWHWCKMHAHQFWWVWLFLVSEILLLSKMAKFPFWGMDYSPWSSKNLIDWNCLKKFMQVWIDFKCIHTNFGGCGLSAFGDKLLPSKTAKFPFWGMDYSPWSSKNLIDRNWFKKIHASMGLMSSVYTPILVGVVSPLLEILLPFKNSQISLLGHGL